MRTHIGQYRIEAPLGRGGMGVVYLGFHENLGRQVAIKALAPELTQQPEFKDRFFSEAKTQARLQHPNIVGVYDLLEEGGEYFIIMELVTGVGLDDRLKEAAGQRMEVQEAVALFSQVLSALDYAHSEGVIHRDIKPSNVMITAAGRVKLTDFGIALLIGDKRLTASQSSIGTPTYMSPEQILRPRSVDHRTDLYSAAVVFYEMLAGKPPFDDDTEYGIKKLHVEALPPDISELNPGLPPGVILALTTALSKNPDDRFPSAGMFLRALQEAVPQALPQGATPLPAPVYRPTTLDSTWAGAGTVPPAPPSPPPAAAAGGKNAIAPVTGLLQGKNRWIAMAAAAVLVLVLGFGTAVMLLSSGKDEEKVAEVSTASNPISSPGTANAPAPLSGQVPIQTVPATGEPGAPVATPLSAPALQQQPELPRPAAAQPTTPPPPKATKKKPSEAVPAPVETAPPPPAPEPAAPAAPAPTPVEEEHPTSPGSAGVDQFKEMEELVLGIANFSEKAMESQEDVGDELFNRLEAFNEAAVGAKREFRKATGTGIRGTLSKLRGKAGDNRALEIKVQDLARKADEIDRLIGSSSSTTQDYWKEVRSKLRRLKGYF